jgi:hypothetical protein
MGDTARMKQIEWIMLVLIIAMSLFLFWRDPVVRSVDGIVIEKYTEIPLE